MADQVELSLPKTVFNERTSFTATVRFRTRSTAAASIPTTAEYKIYNLSTREIIKDWTTLTPAAEITFTVSAQDNTIQGGDSVVRELIQLLVAADRGLSTQVNENAIYNLVNLQGVANG